MKKSLTLKIITRKSALAMWQAKFVANSLERLHPNLKVTIKGISTKGDIVLDRSLAKVGGKGLFVKELENHLLDGSADLAVHSMKDMPYALPIGLELAAILQREDARDALVANGPYTLQDLPQNSVVGTSSLRRQVQVKRLRPDIEIKLLRGNVNTRLAKFKASEYDAIVLAAAGLKRLALEEHISYIIPQKEMLSAVGQGALGIECRSDDVLVKKYVQALNHMPTIHAVTAERAMNEILQGSCEAPIAGYAKVHNNEIELRGLVATTDADKFIEYKATHSDAKKLGEIVGNELLKQGAKEILQDIKNRQCD